MDETLRAVIRHCLRLSPFDKITEFRPITEQVLNNKKVSDHHAIIPTVEIAKSDFSILTGGEKSLFYLIVCRTLSSVYSPYIYESITTEFICEDNIFKASGTNVISLGFKELENTIRT